MEVRDPVHGSIPILDEEIPILKAPFFQRLRSIKQLGFSEYSFPGATHTRYLHSIGVMHVATKVFEKVFLNLPDSRDKKRLQETLRLSALLHDIGHAPLSHSTEIVMPQLKELGLPSKFLKEHNINRRATHEDYTIKAISDSSFTESFKLVREKYGVEPNQVSELITGDNLEPNYFTINGVNYFPILHQLVSSEMDCDRMDYLLRDSYFCGVSYGKFDIDWIIDNLAPCEIDGQAFLGLNERAIPTFDDFLLGRFHMFLMVYFHYRAVCLEKMLSRYFKSAQGEYVIPADIEEYKKHDDYHLKKILRQSENIYAQRIVENNIPHKVFECFGTDQIKNLEELEQYFENQNIEFIRCSSVGRLSKYYDTAAADITKFPMQVIRYFSKNVQTKFFNINDATDLFKKFSQTHAVNRIHCDLDQLSDSQRNAIYSIISL